MLVTQRLSFVTPSSNPPRTAADSATQKPLRFVLVPAYVDRLCRFVPRRNADHLRPILPSANRSSYQARTCAAHLVTMQSRKSALTSPAAPTLPTLSAAAVSTRPKTSPANVDTMATSKDSASSVPLAPSTLRTLAASTQTSNRAA